MMYNPYTQAYGGVRGYGGMQEPYHPYMGMMGHNPMMTGAYDGAGMMYPSGMGAGSGTGVGAGDVGGLQPYDSSKMKQGRMGHYGYLEGRGKSRSLSHPHQMIILTLSA